MNHRHTKPKRGMGAKFAGGNPDAARGRAEDDFYATPWPVTRALCLHYEERLKGSTVWEPCAGDGAMADALLDSGVGRVICSDIKPKPLRKAYPNGAPYRIVRGDALTTSRLPSVDAVITNPPFNIALDLIHKMLTVDGGPPPFLAVVLKATFWHARARASLFDTYPPTAVHPLRWRPDFHCLGAPTMDIIWTVWERQDDDDFLTTYEPFNHPPPM